MHVTRMHRDKVDRYIPGDFDRSLHAKDGMPICAACGKEFKQWKGLRDHLLSGACSRPDQLRSLSTTPEAQVQSEALMALASFRAKVQGSPKLASSPEAQELAQRCTICGFWTPDYTKVKSHLRCQSFSPQMIKGHPSVGRPCMINASTRSNASSFFRCVLAGSGCTAHMRRATPAPPRNLTQRRYGLCMLSVSNRKGRQQSPGS